MVNQNKIPKPIKDKAFDAAARINLELIKLNKLNKFADVFTIAQMEGEKDAR